ncbi:MAG: hypothetical protein U1F51_06820 [Burkholderiales bacterium]
MSQAAVVGTWLVGLPRAVDPLWQVAQLPGATPVCENVAGVHAVVRWQVSQAAVVGTWLVGLPRAVDPLWQVAQDPGATPVCENVAGVHAVVR